MAPKFDPNEVKAAVMPGSCCGMEVRQSGGASACVRWCSSASIAVARSLQFWLPSVPSEHLRYGGEQAPSSVLAPKVGPLGMSPKKVPRWEKGPRTLLSGSSSRHWPGWRRHREGDQPVERNPGDREADDPEPGGQGKSLGASWLVGALAQFHAVHGHQVDVEPNATSLVIKALKDLRCYR